jgi:hypothetical protein
MSRLCGLLQAAGTGTDLDGAASLLALLIAEFARVKTQLIVFLAEDM